MRRQTARWILAICTGASSLMAADSALSAIAEARLVGLAMHQETGRNIYIAALHYDELVPRPDNLMNASGPMALEYRVVARRTSIRSLVGNVLLQGELATGKPPGASVIEFAGDIMATIQGSLYAGDSLEIQINKDKSIVATMEGIELAQTDNREVADYFVMAWVGEKGPSTAFRSSILSTNLDSSLLSLYSAQTASEERLAVINSWADVTETDVDAVTVPVVAPSGDTLTVVSNQSPAHATALSPIQTDKPESNNTEPPPGVQHQAAQAVVVASLSPTLEMILSKPDEETTEEVAMDAMEYSQRLATFNTLIIRNVYSRIRYPRAAVRRDIEGTLELDIVVDKDGSLLAVNIARSSGHRMLDKSALKAATEAFAHTPLEDIDEVAITEYGNDTDSLIIPIPISFILTE